MTWSPQNRRGDDDDDDLADIDAIDRPSSSTSGGSDRKDGKQKTQSLKISQPINHFRLRDLVGIDQQQSQRRQFSIEETCWQQELEHR